MPSPGSTPVVRRDVAAAQPDTVRIHGTLDIASTPPGPVHEAIAHRLPDAFVGLPDAFVGAEMVPGSSASVATRTLQAPFPFAPSKMMGDAFDIVAGSSMIRLINAMHPVG
jgi:hypothetical protein